MKAKNNKWFVYDTEKHSFVEVQGRKLSVPSWKGFELFYHAPLRKSMLSGDYLVLSEARTGGIIAQGNTVAELKSEVDRIADRYVFKRDFYAMLKKRISYFEEEHGVSPRYIKNNPIESPYYYHISADEALNAKIGKPAKSVWETSIVGYTATIWRKMQDGSSWPEKSKQFGSHKEAEQWSKKEIKRRM